MSETQHAPRETAEPSTGPALKGASTFTPAQQMYIARKVARKASLSAMADSLAGGGAAAGDQMRQQGQGTPADVAAEGFSGTAHEIPHRAQMEASFGMGFGHVKAYSDAPARQANEALGANAYAMNDSIAFSTPNPSPSLVAHELTHVMQHTGTGPARKATTGGDGGIDVDGEGEAEQVEAAVAAGKPARSVWDGAGGGAGTATSTAGPARKAHGGKGPALDSRFAMGMTFSTSALEKTYEYTLWQMKPPIEIPIPAVPGLNFLCEPSVKVKAGGAVNWAEKNLSTTLGIEGGVGVGFSYGNTNVAALYGVCEAKASGGFEYKKNNGTGWELSGGIGLSTNFKVGVKLAGGILDYGFEFGKCEIGKLTGLYWKDGKFDKSKIGWEWGDKPKEFFAAMKAAIDKAKQLLAAGAEAARRTMEAARATGQAVYNAGSTAINWVTSW